MTGAPGSRPEVWEEGLTPLLQLPCQAPRDCRLICDDGNASGSEQLVLGSMRVRASLCEAESCSAQGGAWTLGLAGAEATEGVWQPGTRPWEYDEGVCSKGHQGHIPLPLPMLTTPFPSPGCILSHAELTPQTSSRYPCPPNCVF